MKQNHTFDSSPSETIIGHGLHIKGNLECENDLWLDGIVEGNIHAKGNVTLGVNSQVNGNVTATNANIDGLVNGNLKIREKLNLGQSSHVVGDIKTAGLVVGDGAILIGTVSMPTENTSPLQSKTDNESNRK